MHSRQLAYIIDENTVSNVTFVSSLCLSLMSQTENENNNDNYAKSERNKNENCFGRYGTSMVAVRSHACKRWSTVNRYQVTSSLSPGHMM